MRFTSSVRMIVIAGHLCLLIYRIWFIEFQLHSSLYLVGYRKPHACLYHTGACDFWNVCSCFFSEIVDWTYETSVNKYHSRQNQCITTSTTIVAWEIFYVVFAEYIINDERIESTHCQYKKCVLNCQLRRQRQQ